MIPTPDPLVSLSPFEAYTASVYSWAGDVVSTGFVVAVLGGVLVLFALGILAVAVGFRR